MIFPIFLYFPFFQKISLSGSAQHVPGFLALSNRLKTEKKIDLIACVSVNDAFVMEEWRKSQNVNDEILMLSDGSGKLAKGKNGDYFGIFYKGKNIFIIGNFII
jgi:hypothetical protein